MRILVTNDDGIYSPGLCALAEAASNFGEVRIVAPDVEQSSMAHAITSSRPLSHRPVKLGRYSAFRVNGTPADCVALGSHVWGGVDLVLSGVNLGLNVGNSMWHSGTLAAAKQASLLGMRGVALSAGETEDEYAVLKPHMSRVLAEVMKRRHLMLLNVNFPPRPEGIQFTRQSVRHYDGYIVPARDPHGRDIFWSAIKPLEAPEPGTDRWAIEHDLVSITPLRLDLTDQKALDELLRGTEEQ
ncbi:5'/3'-nucleotidase SurE [Pendulispora albinea]|uniref:5'-nucleotidase SurE n=1 Tax=Pendulispora albinea TaxID=2741071 RepID=A0ABZ2LUB7_9BACT